MLTSFESAVRGSSPAFDDPIRATEDINLYVGRRIRRMRKLKGLTLRKLGASAGYTYQQIQKYETGTNCVSAPALKRIARALDVPVGYFFGEA
jgi:ribosome-binding protein aMBF1 (putative translation factor)